MRSSMLLPHIAVLACVPAVAQSLPSRPAITGVAFARMYAADAQASDAFYRMLGLAATPQEGMVKQYPVNASQWLETVPLPSLAPPSRQAMVGFTTTDAPALERYLLAHGVTEQQSLSQSLNHGMFVVLDPEGNRVAFVQAGTAPSATIRSSSQSASHRILHVGYIVHSELAENRFFRDLLGFRPYWRGGMSDTHTDFVSLQVPDGTDWIEYMLNDQPSADPVARMHQLGGADHVSLGVEHIQSAESALAANGCATSAQAANCIAAKMGRDGKVQLNLFDPDGTRIEFMELAPSGAVCCSAFTARHPKP